MNNVTAVILGGGRGTRLFPLTLLRAKPAVGFAGKYRLIDIPISNCINSGIKRVFVLTQFMSASLHRHIMQTYQFDTFTDGFVDIMAATQTPQGSDWFQGTADAVRATLNHTTYYQTDQVLILSGDHLYRMNYAELVNFHRSTRADITLSVYPVSREEAPGLGLLKVDSSGRIEKFIEKPQDLEMIDQFLAPPSLFKVSIESNRCLASMGIYVFQTEILIDLLTNSNQTETDFGKEVIPSAINKYQVVAYPFAEYWMDIGTIRSFYEANVALAQPHPPFPLYQPRWPIYTRMRSLPPARIIRSEIRDSLVVEGADITGANISDSIVGVRSIVGEGTRLSGVVMMGADFYEEEQVLRIRQPTDTRVPNLGIGKFCTIEKTIIDKNARIGDEVIIKAKPMGKDVDGEHYFVRDGITIIPKGAVIPSETEI